MIGTRHMVAAGHYLATQAAFQILEAGGNAVDAGVAGGIALAVVQSEYVGFAGVAPIMIHHAESGRTITISGLGTWPAATDVDLFVREHGGRIPKGVLRSVVPAAPDAWITALELYGTMSFGECAVAAHRFASEGFAVPSLMAEIIADHADEYAVYPGNAAIYLPGGKPPKAGDILRQTDLGNAIAYMIDEEKAAATKGRETGLKAARDAFYRGDIARRIAEHQREEGGWLSEDDLSGFRVEVEDARSVGFGGAEVFYCGPWCQGPLLGQTLAMLDGTDLRGLGHNSTRYIHHLTEVLKLAYADRHALYGDPNFNDVPIDRLMSPDYARKRAALADPERAHPGLPVPGIGAHWDPVVTSREDMPRDPGELDTSYVCVIDRAGNVFSATPSDGSAGAPVVPGLGFVVSGRGVQAFTEPDAPARVGPGRRPRLTPNPAIARSVRDGWTMPIGSPGNDVQPQAMLQVFLNVHVFGMSPQDAVDAPRFATFSYPRSSSPHPYSPGLLQVEERVGSEVIEALEDLGHRVRAWSDWHFTSGGVCTILRDRQGRLEGASDLRRPTSVAGW
ncbi:gamma-glutamyltransferase family protein [Roseitranquillus sediminis]|uniref:gamma-glutamyltransferase family protein n=1 Tax=Roseitranquillus sediminis TaxID=2809051 RepID=UPI001D0CA8BF|nr:gamma-glutamyltransferase [Roseitranquillus sediminis]MBM9593159.1 gamma-glutamyltransferase [Roseitranquillus sediminis]